METTIVWKKSFFKTDFKLLQDNNHVGKMTSQNWFNTKKGELNGKSYLFKSKGILNPYAIITASENEKEIGKVKFHSMMTKATILLADQTFDWKFDNLLQSKWHISDQEDVRIDCEDAIGSGELKSNTNDELLILTGLFIANYIRQNSVD